MFFIIFSKNATATDARLDCVSLDRNIEVDLYLFQDINFFSDMRAYDYRTGYYTLVGLKNSSSCRINSTCFIGSDPQYHYYITLPKAVFAPNRPPNTTLLGPFEAKHSFNSQYIFNQMSCLVY